MYRRLLVTLDGSRVGEAALKHVEELILQLSRAVTYEVILLQVITSLGHYVIAGEASAQVPYTEKEIEQIEMIARKYLEETAENLRSKGINVTTMVTTGKAADEIIRVAHETKADLIAMATHGRSGLSRLTFGSVTDKVLRTGDLPMLVVRAPKDTGNA